MRTTVTPNSDVDLRLSQLMSERRLTFTGAVNGALRAGLGVGGVVDVTFPVFDIGEPIVDLTHANQRAAALEDDEIVRSLTIGR